MTRYLSPVSRGTGKPREYTQQTGSVGGARFWWTCSWTWKNGRHELCARGEAEAAECAGQLAAEHAAEMHAGGAQ